MNQAEFTRNSPTETCPPRTCSPPWLSLQSVGPTINKPWTLNKEQKTCSKLTLFYRNHNVRVWLEWRKTHPLYSVFRLTVLKRLVNGRCKLASAAAKLFLRTETERRRPAMTWKDNSVWSKAPIFVMDSTCWKFISSSLQQNVGNIWKILQEANPLDSHIHIIVWVNSLVYHIPRSPFFYISSRSSSGSAAFKKTVLKDFPNCFSWKSCKHLQFI